MMCYMNNKMNKIVSVLLSTLFLFCSSFVLNSCGSGDDDDNGGSGSSYVGNNKNEPVVTAGYEDVTAGSVTIYGYTNHEKAYDPIVEFGIVISPTSSKTGEGLYENADRSLNSGHSLSSDNKYKVTFNGLAPNTTYYYCAYQELGSVRYFGKVRSFTTNPLTKKFVTYGEPNITKYNIYADKRYGDLYADIYLDIEIPFSVDGTQIGMYPMYVNPYITFCTDYSFKDWVYKSTKVVDYNPNTGEGICKAEIGFNCPFHSSFPDLFVSYGDGDPKPGSQLFYRMEVPGGYVEGNWADTAEWKYLGETKSLYLPNEYMHIWLNGVTIK